MYLVDAGAPQANGRARASEVVNWLIENNRKVRALAGFPELEPILSNATPQEAAHLKVQNHLLTILEYQAARTQEADLEAALNHEVQRIRNGEYPLAE